MKFPPAADADAVVAALSRGRSAPEEGPVAECRSEIAVLIDWDRLRYDADANGVRNTTISSTRAAGPSPSTSTELPSGLDPTERSTTVDARSTVGPTLPRPFR